MMSLKSFCIKLLAAVCGLLAVVGYAVPTDEVEAQGMMFHHVCYHNQQPYFVVIVPFENSPVNCPDNEASWNPVWDGQDGWDCTNKEGTVGCTKKRHIDCEFTNEPGGV